MSGSTQGAALGPSSTQRAYRGRVAQDTEVSTEAIRILSSPSSGVAATHLQLSGRRDNPTPPTPTFEGFIVSTPVTGVYAREAWLDGVSSRTDTVHPGWFSFMDLRRSMSLLFLSPFNFIQFYIPRKALDEVSDELASTRISEFPFPPLSCHFDPVVQALAECILPSFEIAAQASALYVDSVLRAIAVHMATAHARITPLKASSSNGLADWQKKRVDELFDANLAGELALSDIAAECGLSTSHLTRAFRITFGIPPHQYLTNRRVELAKDLMVGSRMSLSEVARTCGFVDQAHFTRVFHGRVGVSPGRWRRGHEL